MSAERILVVEDDAKIANLLADYLAHAGYTPRTVADGSAVEALVRDWQPAAILLDIMLPGKDGLAICRDLRTFSAVPILMVTARAEEIDRLLGLEMGADDYIVKPFSPCEVVARVKAVLRRSAQPRTDTPAAQGFALEEERLAVHWRGQTATLTAVEFQLLGCLARDPGRIWSRQQLMDHIYNDHRVVSDRTIDSHVKKLRRRLADAFPDTDLVQSVYGVGYRFELPD